MVIHRTLAFGRHSDRYNWQAVVDKVTNILATHKKKTGKLRSLCSKGVGWIKKNMAAGVFIMNRRRNFNGKSKMICRLDDER